MREIDAYAKIIHKELILQYLATLYSLPNRNKQIFHEDYSNTVLLKLEDRKKYYSYILSFNRKIHILVKDNKEKEIKCYILRDHVLIWDYTIICVGGSYNKLNYCLFFNLSYKKDKFPFNKGKDLKLTVNCKYYRKRFDSKGKWNDYAWMYSKNLKRAEN